MGASPIEAVRALGKYSLVDKLGEGHLGPVYRGIDQDVGRAVAIRVLCDGIKWDAKVEELFLRECRLVAGLQHPNISAIFDVGKEGASHYVVMESLGSNTLESLIAKKSAMPAEAKLSIMIQVAEGLSHAHKKGILHRDLVPGKIHVMPDGSVKVRDFAITHVLVKHLPHPVVRFGTPIYLSPEQIQQKGYDARSEIFAAGTIFYELLTYLHPFHDPNGNRALDNILQDLEIPTFERFPDPPPGIWTILKTCLARDPNDRYRSMDELSSAFRDLQKSLAEDTQLMLGELYASLTPLKKAAAQPNASKDTINLLQDIEKLSRGAKGADYASLDRLMTALIEQYPVIQAAAGAPDLTNLQSPPVGADLAKKAAVPALEKEVETTTALQPEQTTAAAPPIHFQPPAVCADTEQMPSPAIVVQENVGGGVESNSLNAESPQIELPPPSIIPSVAQDAEKPIAGESGVDISPLQRLAAEENAHKDQPKKGKSPSIYRRIPRPSYRSVAVLLAILVLAAAGYIIWGTEVPGPVRNAWSVLLTNSRAGINALIPKISPRGESTPVVAAESQEESNRKIASLLFKEARDLAAENRFSESKGLLKKVLELNPADERVLNALKEIEERSLAADDTNDDRPSREELARVSAMIDAGRLPVAKIELDRLQQNYPGAPEVVALRKRWQAKSSNPTQDQSRKEEEQKTPGRQNEEERSRQISEFLAHGKYNEASGALNLWLTETPESPRAQELRAKTEEIQRHLRVYTSAMSENRYQDALNALQSVERINPADTNMAEMRRQIETRKAAARAMLTVHRLGSRANLLLDGRPIGNNGEIENESIPIGTHTIAIENEGGLIASRSQEYLEGQRVSFVYDLARLNLRAMSDADRELLVQRKAIEEVHQFELEHDHGAFRGSCQGMLSIDYLDVAYKPSSGSHGFRIPFKLLKLRAEGTSVELFYVSDNKHFQSFKLQDEQTVEKFKRVWAELRNVAR